MSLTKRESEILSRICEGYSSDQVRPVLNNSFNTDKKRKNNLIEIILQTAIMICINHPMPLDNLINRVIIKSQYIGCLLMMFVVLNPTSGQNLLTNSSAETDIADGWTIVRGNWTAFCDDWLHPIDGHCKFWAGWSEKDARIYQDVDLSSETQSIDQGIGLYVFSAWVLSHPEKIPDTSVATLEYYGAADDLLGSISSRKNFEMDCWSTLEIRDTLPIGTRLVRIILQSIQASELHNNGYFDHLYFGKGTDLPDPFQAFPKAARDSLSYHLQLQSQGDNLIAQEVIGLLLEKYACAPESDWVNFFTTYFDTNLYSNDLRWIGYHIFYWGSETKHYKLQAGFTAAAIKKLMELYANSDMNLALVNDKNLRISFFNFQLFIRDMFRGSPYTELKLQLLKLYEDIAIEYPRLIKKGITLKSEDLPYAGGFKFQSVANLLELLGLEENMLERISGLIGIHEPDVRQPYKDIWNKSRLLVMDNNQFNDKSLRAIEDLLSQVPKRLYNLKAVSAVDYFSDPGDDHLPLHSAGVNVFEGSIHSYSSNPWPPDFQSVSADGFMEVLSHEFCHAVDFWNLNPEINPDRFFYDRLIELIDGAGFEDLQYLRSHIGGHFFSNNPQEVIASIGNQYMTHSMETLRLGLERFEQGYIHPINQFLYVANIFSGHSDTTNFYVIDTDAVVHHAEHGIEKNDSDHINKLYISEKEWYRFFLDDRSFVKSILKFEVTDNMCETSSNGQIRIIPFGKNNYQYTWKNGSTEAVQTGLGPGIYDVLITEPELGISEQVSVEVGTTNTISIDILAQSAISCYGADDATATIEVIGGEDNYEVMWDNGEEGLKASALNAGAHVVTVTYPNGCSASLQFEIYTPDSINVHILQKGDPSCPGHSDGFASIDVRGGTPGYSIVWSNGEMGPDATFLGVGSYEVIVEDANNCEARLLINIEEPEEIGIEFDINLDSTGYLVKARISGGTSIYDYLWDDPKAQTSETAISLAEGTYSVTVTDENGCTSHGMVTVSPLTSISELNCSVDLIVFPNPTSRIVTITLKDKGSINKVELLDAKGVLIQRLRSELTYPLVIDMTNVVQGLYLLSIQSEKGVQIQRKVMKN